MSGQKGRPIGKWRSIYYFGMWLECGRNVPNSHIFWNVAGTFQNYIYSRMWQERGRDAPPSRLFFNVAGTCSCNVPQYTFCWNVTGVLSLNVAGTFQHHVLYERGRNVSEQHSKITYVGTWQGCFFLMWKERSQTTFNFNITGTWQRNVPKSLVWKHDRNVLLECGKNVLRPHSIWTWQERDRNVKKSLTFWNVTGTFFWCVAGTWLEGSKTPFNMNVAGTWQEHSKNHVHFERGRKVVGTSRNHVIVKCGRNVPWNVAGTLHERFRVTSNWNVARTWQEHSKIT